MNRPVLITSDIHGDETGRNLIMNAASHFKTECIISAGDQCPDPYDPFYQSIIAVRGNCDRFYEYQNLPFPPLKRELELFGRKIYITHGHTLSDGDFPLENGDIFISGHTHVPVLELRNGIYFANPGSPSRPRSSAGPTAVLLECTGLTLFSLLDFSQICALSFSCL